MNHDLIFIFSDQLSLDLAPFKISHPDSASVFMCEVLDEATYVKHHKKKLAFTFSSMRHFKRDLEKLGYKVYYRYLDEPDNQGSFTTELLAHLSCHDYTRLLLTEPGEYRVLEMMLDWQKKIDMTVLILNDCRFFASIDEFKTFAKDKKQLRMEYFYRYMRKKHNILMQNNKPEGAKWNYDHDNRKPIKSNVLVPPSKQFPVDEISQQVLDMVAKFFPDHFGELSPFYFATSSIEAEQVLDDFIEHRLPFFGLYQDAMKEGEPWLFHSHLGFYLNSGLLLAKNCIDAAVEAYQCGSVPLAAVEGFVRQILGWREFIRGIYWYKMPAYASLNYFNANLDLPEFFWTRQTDMNCLKQCISECHDHAYNHHIQRLMILGNFLLLAGIHPQAVQNWYLSVYADAYEWVELPNVIGMILFADAGAFASKPYAASASYINRMSDYCKNCAYNPKDKIGEGACPYNYLYWHFLSRHQDKLASNPRMTMIYNVLKKIHKDDLSKMLNLGDTFLSKLSKYKEPKNV
eukprot:COSAG01_NODE_52_length_31456_cov_125.226648_19_plen_517_part_00